MSLIGKFLNEWAIFIEALDIINDANLPSIVDPFVKLEQFLNYLFKNILLVWLF